MIPSKLIDNFGEFAQISGFLLPKSASKRVYVYVESEEDIAFWYFALRGYESRGIRFEINLPYSSTDTLKKGKAQVLTFLKGQTSQYLIGCVDSDFDYLLQNNSAVNTDPYIFHTYTHAIENYQCFSESLTHVCTQSVFVKQSKIDFTALLKWYSQVTYPLLLWYIALQKAGNETAFMLTDFCAAITIQGRVNVNTQGQQQLAALQLKINAQMVLLENSYPDIKQTLPQLEVELAILGLSDNSAYLFLHGHTLCDCFVLPFLNSVCDKIKSEAKSRIATSSTHDDQRQNELSYYEAKILPVEIALRNNTEYQSCFLYQKLQSDLSSYVDGLLTA